MTTTTRTPRAGDQVHFLKAGVSFSTNDSIFGRSEVSRRAQTITLTDDIIEANRDRTGFTIWDLLHNEDAQIERFGEVVIAPGPAPDTLTSWDPTNPRELAEARAAAAAKAHSIVDEVERREAMREVTRVFGGPGNPLEVKIKYRGDDY